MSPTRAPGFSPGARPRLYFRASASEDLAENPRMTLSPTMINGTPPRPSSLNSFLPDSDFTAALAYAFGANASFIASASKPGEPSPAVA